MSTNKTFNKVQLDVKFTQATSRVNLISEENISISFGKISKYFADLHSQAFTGYTHPTYTARTGKPTGNQTPGFGSTFTISQITSDGTGHVTAATDRTVKIPDTTMGAASADAAGSIGLVPAPAAGKQTSFLRGDGTWAVPTNTDTKVTQSQTTTTNYRPILFGANNSTDVSTLANTVTDQAYTSTKMFAQPSTGLIFCTGRKIENVTIQTGSTKQAHITLQTLMTWLITTKTYIPSGQYCHVIISTTWKYADNDILQVSIDGTNYEIQLAGVIIEFIGGATSYNAGMFRLLIHSSPTIDFTATSGYSKFPVSTIAEYTCNGSDYSPTWKKIWNSHPTYTSKSSGLYKITVDGTGHVSAATAVAKADITALGIPGSDTNTTYTIATGDSNGQIKVTPSSGSAYNVSVKGLGSAAYTASTSYVQTHVGANFNVAKSGYFAVMANENSDNPNSLLPTQNEWWHILSMSWNSYDSTDNSDVKTWVSQLAIPTYQNKLIGMKWRTNSASGSALTRDDWATVLDERNSPAFKAITQRLLRVTGGVGWYRILTLSCSTNNGQLMNDIKIFVRRHYNNGTPESFSAHIVNNYSATPPIYITHAIQASKYFTQIRVSKTSDGKYQYVEIYYNSSNQNAFVIQYNYIAPYSLATSAYGSPVYPTDNTDVSPITDSPTAMTTVNIPTNVMQANYKSDGTYWGLVSPKGEEGVWIRTSTNGLIPSTTGGATRTTGSSLGTSTWYFLDAYIKNVHTENIGAVTVDTTSLENKAGSFVFKGSNLLGNVNDWVGIQADAGNDKFQIMANTQLMVRQNDTGGTSTAWSPWLGCLTPNEVIGSGGITVTKTDVTIGSGDTAFSYKGKVTLSHTNSITAVTSAVFKKITYDAQGHITGTANVTASDIPSHTHSYLPLSGTTINNPNTSSVSFTNGMTGNILFTNTGGTNGVARGIGGIVGASDSWSVRGYQTADNKGCLEIAVGDDGDEGIYVRQYTSGAYKATFSNNAGSASGLTYRELVLMAPSTGASTFPSDVTLSGGRLYLSGSPGNYGQLNLKSASYNVMFRNDNANTYILLTAQDDPDGAWTSARPLTINNSTGICSINGNAATASSWATARTLTLSGQLTGSVSVKGDANMTLKGYLDRAFIYDDNAVPDGHTWAEYAWHKFAEVTITTVFTDCVITFLVSRTYGGGAENTGILSARLRTNGNKAFDTASFVWLVRNSGLSKDDFVMVYTSTSGTSTKAELWCRIPGQYHGLVFNVLKEHKRQYSTDTSWTLVKTPDGTGSTHGSSSYPTTGITGTIISSDGTITNSTTGTSSNVTGTVAIANGGTGATTRLGALKALTNEGVGTDAQYFLTITQNWGKGGYSTVANVKTVLGLKSAAYTESSDYVPNTQAGVNAAINLLSTGSSDPTLADYYVAQYAGGGTTTTSYHRRPISALWNTFKGLITLETTGSGNAVTAVSIANDGDNNRKITVTKGTTFLNKFNSSSTLNQFSGAPTYLLGIEAFGSSTNGEVKWQSASSCNVGHATSATTADKLNTNAGTANRPVYFSGGVPVQCDAPLSGSWFKGVPQIGTDGVMEIGRYIDFHSTNAGTTDYDVRLDVSSTSLLTMTSNSGTPQIRLSGTLPRLRFTQTTSGKAYDNALCGISAYPGNTAGVNLVIQSGGNTFIGGGESPASLYTRIITTDSNPYGTSSLEASEQMFITSDNSIYFVSGAGSISATAYTDWTNLKTALFDSNGYFRPSTTDKGGIGTSSYPWHEGYINTLTSLGGAGGRTSVFDANGLKLNVTSSNNWSMGIRFYDNAGESQLGGFGAYGTVNAFSYHYIGPAYNNPIVKIERSVGTTSAVGYDTVTIGNSTASGTANNQTGRLTLYGTGAYAGTIVPTALSAARTYTLPNASGTISLDGHTHSYAGSSSAGGPATKVATEVGNSAGARPVFYAYLGDNTRVVYNTNFTYNPSGNVLTATTFAGALSGNATSATTAEWATLLKAISTTTTASASTWNIPSGSYQVWGERFSDTRLKYTPSGGSETTITDTGDLVMWLTGNATSNQATLNMRIDGTYYGSFSGNITGNVSGNVAGNVNGKLYNTGTGSSWWNDRDNAVIRITTGDTQYRPLWTLLTATSGSWGMGNHTGDDLTFNFISKAVYDSKANPSTYAQIKFTNTGAITANGLTLSSSGYGPLSIVRTGNPYYAGIKFYNNTSTYLGSFSINTANGTFVRFKTDEATSYEIIDRSVVRNNTAVGTLGWTSASADTVIPTVNTIAYWNGAYSGTSSNLAYCKKGEFGTIVTKSTTDYSKVSISRNLTSGTKVGTITIDGTATDLYCQTNTNTDTKVNVTLGTTTKAYLLGTTTTPTSTATGVTSIADTGVYLGTAAGSLIASSIYGSGAESQSTAPTGGYRIYDCRSVNVSPNDGDKAVNFYFHMADMPDTSLWWSVLHMRGWTGGYSAWEIAGPSHNTDQRTTPLYVRTSNTNTAWGSWRKIYDTSNPPTASEVGALASTLLKVTESTNLMLDGETNAFGYVSGLTKAAWNFQQTDGTIIRQRYNILWKTEIFMDYRTGQMSTRGKNNGTWQDWRIHLDSGNYTSYTVTKTGSGASGTWGISITGNAATATRVATTVLFDQSDNTSTSISLSTPPTDTQYLKLYFKSSGNSGTSSTDNSVYSIAEVPYMTGVKLGGILQVAQSSDNQGVLRLTALAFTVDITTGNPYTLRLIKVSKASRISGSGVSDDSSLSANIIKVVAYR